MDLRRLCRPSRRCQSLSRRRASGVVDFAARGLPEATRAEIARERKLGQNRWLDAFTSGQIRTGGVSPHFRPSLAPRPAGLFLFQSMPIESTDTRPLGRMDMLETTTLHVVASTSPSARCLLRAGFSWARARGSRRAARLVRGDKRPGAARRCAAGPSNEVLHFSDHGCSGKPGRTRKRRGRSQKMAAPWITDRARGGEMGGRLPLQCQVPVGSCRRRGGSKKRTPGLARAAPRLSRVTRR
jgi:hypothetical protein